MGCNRLSGFSNGNAKSTRPAPGPGKALILKGILPGPIFRKIEAERFSAFFCPRMEILASRNSGWFRPD